MTAILPALLLLTTALAACGGAVDPEPTPGATVEDAAADVTPFAPWPICCRALESGDWTLGGDPDLRAECNDYYPKGMNPCAH